MFISNENDEYSALAIEALGCEHVIVAIPSTSWGELFGHEDLPVPNEALISAKIWDIVSADVRFEEFYGKDIVGEHPWCYKVNTKFGEVVYISDNYPRFYMCPENSIELLSNK